MANGVNADLGVRAVMDTNTMAWAPSPSGTVQRKRLDLAAGDPEQARVTSLVRYDAGAAFPPHPHPDGEEIFVLDGVFSDESGDYPQGSFLLNPEGFEHSPRSDPGCLLLVKLRQYPGARRHVVRRSGGMAWEETGLPGIRTKILYREDGFPEMVTLAEIAPGAHVPLHDHAGGEEIFVISGELADEFGRYGAGTWVRQPPGSRHAPWSDKGCRLYVKTGHLIAP